MKLAFACLLATATALKTETVSDAAGLASGLSAPANYESKGKGFCTVGGSYEVKECRIAVNLTNQATTVDDCKSVCDNDLGCAAFAMRDDMKRCLVYTENASDTHCASLLTSSPYDTVRSFQSTSADPWTIDGALTDGETTTNDCFKKLVKTTTTTTTTTTLVLTYYKTTGACRVSGNLSQGTDERHESGPPHTVSSCKMKCAARLACSGFALSARDSNEWCVTFTTAAGVWGASERPDWDCYVNERNAAYQQANYYSITSGSCSSSGGMSITNMTDCEAAARNLGFANTWSNTWTCEANPNVCGNARPQGCFREGGSLQLFPDSTGDYFYWGQPSIVTASFCKVNRTTATTTTAQTTNTTQESYVVNWVAYESETAPQNGSFSYTGPSGLEFYVGNLNWHDADYGCANYTEVPAGYMRAKARYCDAHHNLNTMVIRRSDTKAIVGVANCCNNVPRITSVSGSGTIKGR